MTCGAPASSRAGFLARVRVVAIAVAPRADDGRSAPVDALVDDDTACVVVQQPGFLGGVQDLAAIGAAAHARGALFIVVVTEALSLGMLRAPDGTWLADEEALVRWCLAAWERAADWLRERMPDQIGRWWSDPPLAQALRRIVHESPDRDTALDRALALIDPAGFGREQPRLACDTSEIDFGTLPNSVVRRDITIENVGRRHVSLWVFLPRWIAGTSGLLGLPPGIKLVINGVVLLLAVLVDALSLGSEEGPV